MKRPSRKKAVAVTKPASTCHEDALFARVVEIIEAARGHVSRSVNTAIVQAYWLIGREIVEVEQHGEKRAGYGDEVIERLARYQMYLPTEEELRAELAREREAAERALRLAASVNGDDKGSESSR
jgi:hypothetical protein